MGQPLHGVHPREVVEQGFEVAVVKDATAGAQLPGADGYRAALLNFRMLVSSVQSTAEVVEQLQRILVAS